MAEFVDFAEKYPDLKVIIISAKNFSDMQIDFALEDNVDTISKPFDSTASELIRCIP